MLINEALTIQMEVQKHLHAQLEVWFHSSLFRLSIKSKYRIGFLWEIFLAFMKKTAISLGSLDLGAKTVTS